LSEDQFNSFSSALSVLKTKWKEVPGTTQDRVYSSDLLVLSDSDLLRTWTEFYVNNCEGQGYSVKGWFHDLYRPLAALKGKWLEVGSGLGYDGVYFAEQGAAVTFIDIVEENLDVIKRICKIKGIKDVKFILLDVIEIINTLPQYDVVLAIGALINAPYELMVEERKMLASHLVPGGRWIELCYPKERWIREGELDFKDWGKRTDGERTPWVEWYDIKKLMESLEPHKFEAILNFNFHNNDFNWFDLVKRS